MKLTFRKQCLTDFILCGALGLLPACAGYHQSPLSTSAVGPPPADHVRPSADGRLMVYSTWDTAVEYNSFVGHHSAYTLSSDDGAWVKKIVNRRNNFEDAPESVILSPGNYKVAARAARVGKIVVPVVVRAGETTTVYLDSYDLPPGFQGQPGNVVKLPDGKIVGWAALPRSE